MSHMLVLLFLGASAQWKLVTMEEDAKKDDAVCLDGTPGAYYVKWGQKQDINKWIIHFMGGGWCTGPSQASFLSSCYQRSLTNLGSTKFAPPSSNEGGHDLLSTNTSHNPVFATWTSVVLQYCDGASFSGDADPIAYNGTLLHFRGARILRAVLRNLLAEKPPLGGPSLSSAERVILTGNSAGGLSAILHADYVASRLNPKTVFKAVPLVGFFIDAIDVAGEAAYTKEYQMVVKVQNIQTADQVNADCIAAYGVQDRWKCFMAQYAYPFVKTPIFLQNSKLDNWQLRNILAIGDPKMVDCVNNPKHACNATQYEAFQHYGVQFLSALKTAQSKNPRTTTVNGGVITSCDLHDHLIGNQWNTITVKDHTLRQIMTPWLLDDAKSLGQWIYDGDWPNNPTCPGPHLS